MESDSGSDSDSSEEIDFNEQFNRDLPLMKENSPTITELYGRGDNEYIANLSDEDWEELGLAISDNEHLKEVHFSGALNDQKLSSLFSFAGLTKSTSIKTLLLYENHFSLTGVRSLSTFLQNSIRLRHLDLSDNNIESEGFNTLLRVLRDSPINKLQCESCAIEHIRIDMDSFPRKLKRLNLSDNNINSEGCREIAKLLQGPDSKLKDLELKRNIIDDEGVAILVDALRSNKSLTTLNLKHNIGISEKGKIMLLKLVDDISSIEATIQSNHTLRYLSVDKFRNNECPGEFIQWKIYNATTINRDNKNNLEAAGKEKVIQTQLWSERRAELAQLQGVSQSPYSEFGPLMLPEVLSLVYHRLGPGEMHIGVKSSIVEIVSTVNRKQCIKEQVNHYLARVDQLTSQLTAIEEAESGVTEAAGDESRSRKRPRKWWWGIWGVR